MTSTEERVEARRLIAIRRASGQEVWVFPLQSALRAYEEAQYQEVLDLLDVRHLTEALQKRGQ